MRDTRASLSVLAALRLALPCVLLILGGCGGPAAPPDTVLRLGLASGPRNLDPRLATDAVSERVNRLLYARLVELDERGLPQPGLATWKQLTPTHYRFTLGTAGRTFAGGSRLVADDVVATFESILDPATGSPHRAVLGLIDTVASDGPDRIDFRLATPDPLFPAYLGIGILPAAGIAAGHPFQRAPLGSGPFRFVAWPEPGRLRLARRADGQAFELVAVRDPSVRVMKLLRGEIDMLQNDLSPELVGFLRGRDEVRVRRRDGVNFSYLGFNLEDPATGRLAVREAIAFAIDRNAVIRYLFQGAARPAAAIFPPEHWVGADLRPPAYDPAAARARLAAAGFGPGHPLRLVYKSSSDPFRLRLAAVLQAQLAAVGIELEIRSYDWGTFFGDVQAGRFQLYGLTWVGVRIPDIFRYAFHSASLPPDGANRGRYRSVRVDDLIERARREPDLAVQADLYRAIQRQLLADLPYIPLWYEDQVFVARRDIRGYRLAADGNFDGLARVERRVAPGATRP